MRILVLGGSGFIGTRLTRELLAEGHEVVVGDIRRSESHADIWRACDVRQIDEIREAAKGCDAIVNLAAEHRDDIRPISLYQSVNVDGSKNVCRTADELGITRNVFASTVAVYGYFDGVADEGTPLRPFNEYGRSKAEAEQAYREWLAHDPSVRSLVIVRPAVVFGEGNRGNVYNLLNQIGSGRFVMVGDGRNQKSMAYVANVTAFIRNSLSLGPGEHLYNYADPPDLDMETLVQHVRERLGKGSTVGPRIPYAIGLAGGTVADAVARITGRTFPISAVRVRKFCSTSRISADKALADGFEPVEPILDALDRVIEVDILGEWARMQASAS